MTLKAKSQKKSLDVLGFYDILGVAANSDTEDIKEASRIKLLETHPDKGGNQEEFMQVLEAYKTLSCPAKRAKYDALEKEGVVLIRVAKTENVFAPIQNIPAFWKEPCSILSEIDVERVREWHKLVLKTAQEFGVSLEIKTAISKSSAGFGVMNGIAYIGENTKPERWGAVIYILQKLTERETK